MREEPVIEAEARHCCVRIIFREKSKGKVPPRILPVSSI